VEIRKIAPKKISVTITHDLHTRLVRCMELEGYRVVSEFVSVAIHRRCRDIEQSAAVNAHPVSEK
jgi:hypothetical protein